jgi:hypothetical protein
MNRPPSGSMVYWRRRGGIEWRFGYCTYVEGSNLIRMGWHNGDTTGGPVVSVADIEWRKYT